MTTKFIQTAVTSINKNNAGEMLRRIGEHCVRQAYAGNNEDTQFALDNLAQWARKPLVNWLRSVGGLAIENPASGSARYMVDGVKDQKTQAKALEAAKDTPVLHVEHAIATAKKEKPLKGLAQDRAQSAVIAAIKRLKKVDPEAGAMLNEWLVLGQQEATRKALEQQQETTRKPLRRAA